MPAAPDVSDEADAAPDELVHLEITDAVATVTLDSPHNRNALSRRLVAELGERVSSATTDPGVRAVVVTHRGPAFCAGADLREQASTAAPADPTPMVAIMRMLMDAPVPTIAAVDGAVRAGGIGLMAACDLVVVGRDVTFALTEVRIGVAAAIISVPILARVPAARIATAMLTGETFDAAEARSMGLVTHVTDDVAATARSLCDGVRAGAPRAVAATKGLLRRVPTLPRDQAFDEMATLSTELFGGAEAAEGISAFRERRQPDWAS